MARSTRADLCKIMLSPISGDEQSLFMNLYAPLILSLPKYPFPKIKL